MNRDDGKDVLQECPLGRLAVGVLVQEHPGEILGDDDRRDRDVGVIWDGGLSTQVGVHVPLHGQLRAGVGQAVPENVAAKVLNRARSITVEAELADGDEGVLVCHGSNIGGYTLFIQDGKLHYVPNYVGAQELTCRQAGR